MVTAVRTLFLFDIKLASELGEGSAELPWGRRRKHEFQIKDNFVAKKVRIRFETGLQILLLEKQG